MVTDWLLDELESLLVWLANLMPDISIDGAWSGVGFFLSQLTALNYWLPISELAAFVGGVFILVPLLVGATFVTWVLSFIRGGSARA